LHATGDATLAGTGAARTQRNAGLLTACFAVGQLSGPLLAALSSHFSGGLQPALVIAGSGLLIAGGLQSVSAGRAAWRKRRRTHCSALTKVMPSNTSTAPMTKFTLNSSPSSSTPKVTPNSGVMNENTARLAAR
jgi:hypothetical protein